LEERRKRLEAFARRQLKRNPGIELSPLTRDPAEAERWLKDGGGRLDGVIAKRRDVEYRPADGSAMQKIKNLRSADCVVGGFRFGEGRDVVGSLLLGLYDDEGLLHHVGFTSNVKSTERKALTNN